MYSCLYYWIIEPIRGGIIDSPDREPAFSVYVDSEQRKDYELRLYCDPKNIPEFVRCKIPDLEAEELPEDTLRDLQILKEHMLSILQMTYRSDVTLASPSAAWTFIKKGEQETVRLSIDVSERHSLDIEATKNLFAHSLEIRELLRLYVDGMNVNIPLQYRYLSFYKLLELQYRRQGSWNKGGLNKILEPYFADFNANGLSGDIVCGLHDIRDKCAHIRTGKKGKRERLGITHLNLSEVSRVERVLPVLRAVCAAIINERVAGRFILPAKILFDTYERQA